MFDIVYNNIRKSQLLICSLKLNNDTFFREHIYILTLQRSDAADGGVCCVIV